MEYLFLITVLILSIVIHEIAHGAMAYHLGDPTAKYAGRLTLNPLKHLDPIGSFLVPIILIITTGMGIGWAKPVPINPYNFRDQKWGNLKVAFAGPAANLLIAIAFGLIIRLLFFFNLYISQFIKALSIIVFINLLLAIFNLIPIPPLDGSHILFTFLSPRMIKTKIFLEQFGFIILLFLFFFSPWFWMILNNIIELIFKLLVGTSF